MENGAIAAIAGLIGGGATAVAVVVESMSVKNYLIACEYLQIDPAKVFDLDFIKARIEIVCAHWSKSDEVKQVEKLNKTLKWFEKNYVKLAMKGFSNQNYSNKFEKLANKGELIIHEGSVNETYVKGELCQTNYDFYSGKVKRQAYILIGLALFGVLCGFVAYYLR
jgi:hypothetical protein